MYSRTALKIYAAIKEGVIKSNASFWRQFNDIEKINELDIPIEMHERQIVAGGFSLICALDDGFPLPLTNLKPSERPCFFAYKGDISLLSDRARNAAVVGTLQPNGDIIDREAVIVNRLVESGYNIVSGLAVGCDTAAHTRCMALGGKTIAFLPSALERIYPERNRGLASRIPESGGLVVTEYVNEPSNRYQAVGRFIARDRLQAMYAAKIILVASHARGEGDSGSRHAMAKAVEYNTERFVMYKEASDKTNALFGLNRQLFESGVSALTL